MTIDLAQISLAALLLVMVLSCTTEVNPGFVSLASAWVIGMYVAPHWGRHFTTGEILAGFPTDLFLTLVGVTLFFTLRGVTARSIGWSGSRCEDAGGTPG